MDGAAKWTFKLVRLLRIVVILGGTVLSALYLEIFTKQANLTGFMNDYAILMCIVLAFLYIWYLFQRYILQIGPIRWWGGDDGLVQIPAIPEKDKGEGQYYGECVEEKQIMLFVHEGSPRLEDGLVPFRYWFSGKAIPINGEALISNLDNQVSITNDIWIINCVRFKRWIPNFEALSKEVSYLLND